jgi:hypothetical protein
MERVTPSLKERYDQEIHSMLEKKLTTVGRVIWLISTVVGIGFAAAFGGLAAFLPTDLPWQGRLGFAGGALFGIGWAWLGVRILRRGSIQFRTDEGMVAAMPWAWPVFLLTIFMVWAPNNLMGLRMILMGLAFLLMGGVFLTAAIIRQSELRSREKLLEIEYRLAELTESLRRDGLAAPGSGA